MIRCGFRLGMLGAALLLSAPLPRLAAQDGPTLIRQGLAAYNDFDTERALTLLRRGLDPAAGPQDSLWAQGVQILAQALFDEGEEDLMTTWARWAMRAAPDMVIDTLNLVSDVIQAFEAARAATAPGPSDVVTTTAFSWPPGDPGTGPGRIDITRPGVPVPVSVLVVGRGVVTPGQGLSLPAGSYQVQASAEGYQPVQVTREVLPGVTTVLAFDLQPTAVVVEGVLDESVRTGAARQVVGITVHRFAQAPVCGAGAFVGEDGLLLTSYRAIRGADSVAVTLGGQTIGADVQVAAYDVSRDVAVLKVPLIRGDSLPTNEQVEDGQYAWGFGFTDCAGPADQRVRIASWQDPPDGPLTLRDSLGGAVPGSPLIDQQGAVIGLWSDPLTVLPTRRARNVLADARRNVAASRLRTLTAVGDEQNHRYGSVAISSTITGAVARVVPLESWQWPALAQTSFVPFTFSGPAGRYRLELTVNGEQREQLEIALRAGVADRLAVDPGVPAAPRPQIAREPGGGFPWIIALLGGGGAAAALAVLMGGGGGPPVDDGGDPTTGSIRIRFRDP